MRKIHYVLLVLFVFTLNLLGSQSQAAATQKKVELENTLRDRVLSIVEKVQSAAIVQVQVNLKKVASSDLPGVGFEAEVIPLENNELGADSIQDVTIRIITQEKELPDWVKKEVEQATQLGVGIKVVLKYEKVDGQISNARNEIAQFFREDLKPSVQSALENMQQVRWGIWGLVIGLMTTLGAVAVGVFSLSRRIEAALARVIEEKVVPAMQQMRGASGGGAREKSSGDDKPQAIQLSGGGGGGSGAKELADIPVNAVVTLLSDCYWTQSDAYAHYIWQQITQTQREMVLSMREIDTQYFSFIRQFAPVNLNYHLDARYIYLGQDFRAVNQEELTQWVRKNSKEYWRVTPLRWDLLPLSLSERIEFAKIESSPSGDIKPIELKAKSKARVLPMKLDVKQLSAEDEEYIWTNAESIPQDLRSSLKTLAWLAMAPLEYRQSILSEVDARQLAEAWVGPAVVLEKLKEALPPKKLEMLEHFMKEVVPYRDSDAFSFLVDAGLKAPQSEPATKLAAA